MGHIYALGGPSGAGKTTFLNRLFSTPQCALSLLVRATSRAPRPGEVEGADYNFYTPVGFLQKVFSNDFVHVEQFGDSFFGIEYNAIEQAVQGPNDAIIMSGIYGGTRLKSVFGGNISLMFMYSGSRRALMNPDCLTQDTADVQELKRRLRQKIATGVVSPEDATTEEYVRTRMRLNVVELAYVNGRMRSGEDIKILENLRDQVDSTLDQFQTCRQGTSGITVRARSRTNVCFVLMPFATELTPVFEDHILPSVQRCGLECLRADRIFSNRPLMDDVLASVRNARIVISDLTANNPNVFYETGICHALGKEVILITQDSGVPFDLRHIRHIRYQYTPRGMQEFGLALEETIRSILTE